MNTSVQTAPGIIQKLYKRHIVLCLMQAQNIEYICAIYTLHTIELDYNHPAAQTHTHAMQRPVYNREQGGIHVYYMHACCVLLAQCIITIGSAWRPDWPAPGV